MATRKKARKKKVPKKVYESLVLEVISYSASVDAAINYDVLDKQFHYDEAPVYSFHSLITIECQLKWPENRQKDPFTLYIYGRETSDKELTLTLDDCQVRNEDGSRKFLKKRGEYVPVYKVRNGVGILNKVRGENWWIGTAWVSPQCLNDMLVLLVSVTPLYVSLHEMKEGRKRWISGITLQTDDPEEE